MRYYGTNDPGMMVTFLGGAVSGTVSSDELTGYFIKLFEFFSSNFFSIKCEFFGYSVSTVVKMKLQKVLSVAFE